MVFIIINITASASSESGKRLAGFVEMKVLRFHPFLDVQKEREEEWDPESVVNHLELGLLEVFPNFALEKGNNVAPKSGSVI